jgi:hypothetical protein
LHTLHGEFNINLDQDIINITVKGAFNDVGAKAVIEQLVQHITTLNNEPFAILANLLEFEGGTPDVFAVTDEFNAWLNSKNMVAKALVFTSPALIMIEQTLVKSKKGQNIQYFADETEAIAWIDSQFEKSNSKLA